MLLSPSDTSTPGIHEPDPELDPNDLDNNANEESFLDNVWGNVDGELDQLDAGSEVSGGVPS